MFDQTAEVRDADDDVRTCSRRSVLRTTGAAAGVAVTSGVATAQNGTTQQGTGTETRITTLGVIIEQEEIDQGLTGFWIHVGPSADPIQASIDDECDIVDWGDQDTIAYDVHLIDRTADPTERSIELYLPRRVEISAGDLFIINDVVPCESAYMGVELEQMGAPNLDAGVDAGPPVTTQTEESLVNEAAPEFGWLAGVAGLVGGSVLFERNRRRDTE